MAGFKEEIKAKFKAKFPKVNLAKNDLDALVDEVDATTDAEADIDAKLDGLNKITSFALLARQADMIRDLEAKTKAKPADQTKPTEEGDKPAPTGDEAPAWFKAYTERTDAEIAAIKNEKTATTRKQALTDKVKDAPESYKNTVLKAFNRMQFESDEAFNEYLAETETDVTAVIQEQSNAGLGKDGFKQGLGGNLTKGEASQAELDAVFKDLKV